MHRTRSLIALGLALAALTLALAGCSGSGGGGDDGSPSSDGGTTTSTKTYTNDQYGFSITYSDQFTQGEPVAGTGAGGSSVFDVVFADKDGPVVADRYVDAVQVSVYELAREVKASDVPELKSELQGIVDQMMSSMPTAEVVGGAHGDRGQRHPGVRAQVHVHRGGDPDHGGDLLPVQRSVRVPDHGAGDHRRLGDAEGAARGGGAVLHRAVSGGRAQARPRVPLSPAS